MTTYSRTPANSRDKRRRGLRPDDDHEGIVLVYDGWLSAFEVTAGIVAAYPDRDALRGYEVLDDWL